MKWHQCCHCAQYPNGCIELIIPDLRPTSVSQMCECDECVETLNKCNVLIN